jgi:hypothetical protein
MANVFTAVQPVLYSAARETPREITGLLAAVNRNFDDKGVAKGDSVKIGIAPALTAASVTASQQFTAGSDRTVTSKTLTLNNFKEVSWNYTAEEEKSLMNAGVAQDLLAQTVQQGIRTLVNTIESYTYGIAYVAASRAYGTAGTAPFGSTIADLANTRKILVDNGASLADASLVCDTAAGVNLRSLANLYKVNEGGTAETLRQGVIGRLYDFDIRESAQVSAHTKGTMTGALINNAAAAIGDTAIIFDGGTAGASGFKAGDVITIAGDTNKYVVTTGLVAASGTITIAEPGLRVAVADNAAITVGNSYTANLLLTRSAVSAVVRPGLQPEGAIAEQSVITDPNSGLSFLMLRVPGNAMASWYMRVVYDAFVPNPYAMATLLG